MSTDVGAADARWDASTGGGGAPGLVAGVDIGGTKTAVCLASCDGRLLADVAVPTDTTTAASIVTGARRALTSLLREHGRASGTLRAIGICAPGRIVDSRAVVSRYNLARSSETIHVADAFESSFGVRVQVENDANAAALGELWFGAARGHRHALFVTVGTGIGSGIIVDGEIYRGARGLAGEVAHMSVDVANGRPCKCGGLGCIEAMASGAAIAESATQALARGETSSLRAHYEERGAPPASLVLAAAAVGDPLALAITERAGRLLGGALAGAASMTDPELIVLGGGLMQGGAVIWLPLRDEYSRHRAVAAEIPLVAAGLDQRAGVLGAAALVLDRERLAPSRTGGERA